MKILSIETSASACSVALMLDNEVKVIHEIAPMQQAKLVLPFIETILENNNLKLKNLDALAFGCGPGSFTGVRIAASVMQGIAYATDLPLIQVSSLAATAQSTFMELGWKKNLVALDARMNEIYFGAYEIDEKGVAKLVNREALLRPDQVEVFNDEWHGVGNAWGVYQSNLKYRPNNIDVSRLPMAGGVCILAEALYKENKFVSPAAAMPTYLRDNVAFKSK